MDGRTLKARAAASILAASFLGLSLLVEIAGSMPADEWVLTELYDAFGTDLDDVMTGIGAASDTVPLMVVSGFVIVLLAATDRRRDALWYLAVVVVVAVGNRVLKEVFSRPRPDVRPIPETVSRYSFPSGHAANSLALVAALLLVFPTRTWRLAKIIAGAVTVAVIGFSRLAVGAHYPSDLLAAWLWVGAWVTVMWMFTGSSAPLRGR